MAHLDHADLDLILISSNKNAVKTHPFSKELEFSIELVRALRLRDRIFEPDVFSSAAICAAEEEIKRGEGISGEIVCYFIHRYIRAYREFIVENDRLSQK